jgi:arylsulfatase A-like enzyme
MTKMERLAANLEGEDAPSRFSQQVPIRQERVLSALTVRLRCKGERNETVQLGQLPLSRITIAQRLKEKDHATGYFGKWPLGPDADKYPDAQGFDVNIGDERRVCPQERSSKGSICAT